MKRGFSLSSGVLLIIGAVVVSGVLSTGDSRVSAVSFQSVADMKFTFNPSLTVSLSSDDLVISDLAPGNSADSNEITITVGTNTAYGYSLQATAGNSSYAGSANFNANDLVLTNGATVSSSETNKFTSLATNASVASMSSASPDTWGYAYATYDTANSTWNSYSNYSGLPVYTETNGAELISSDGVADSKSIKFKIAAKAGDSRAAGEYTNVVNFIAVANPKPPETIATATYMQDVEECPSTLTTGQVYTIKDARDEKQYNVAKLADGKCWMLDNLALDLTNSNIVNALSADNTNIDADNESAILTSLKSGNRSAGNQYATDGITNWTSSYSYSVPMVNMTNKDVVPQGGSDPLKAETLAGNWKVGGYYNYCAASAGSYCYGSGTSEGTSSGNATSSICPKGWRMPGGSNTIALTATPPTGEYRNLGNIITGTTSGNYSGDNYTNFRTALHLPLSGYFFNGSASYQGSYGDWWSSTRFSNDLMHSLYADTSGIGPASYFYRHYGYSLRCVLGS